MLTLHQIRERLADRRLDIVAEATGVPYSTVRSVRDNAEANPTWRTLSALSKYLERDSLRDR